MMLFRRRHEHEHRWVGHRFSGPDCTGHVLACRCGSEVVELTPAGWQQVGWWMNLGLSYEQARDGVEDGSLPYPLCSVRTGHREDEWEWRLVDTRPPA